jgi:hypothetical protein
MWPPIRDIVMKEMAVLKDADIEKLGKLLAPLANWFPAKR